jgi:hypothetical protein
MSDMVPYVIRPGDHMPSLALKMNFDADTVWAHPKNADLKKLRGDMHILCSGDVLYVPTPPPRKWMTASVGGPNKFVATVKTVSVTVTFKNGGKPLAGEACNIHELPDLTGLSTTGDGTLTFQAPVTLEAVTVEFPGARLVQRLRIGHIDPIAELSGVYQRLKNLGYITAPGSEDDVDEESLRDPLSRFQVAQGSATTDGTLDDDTRQKLLKVHGC